MRLDVLDQAVLILSHLEEVVVLAELFDGALAVRAESVLHVFFSPESFIERAVPTGVRIFINKLLVVELLKISSDNGCVLVIGRSDEGVI